MVKGTLGLNTEGYANVALSVGIDQKHLSALGRKPRCQRNRGRRFTRTALVIEYRNDLRTTAEAGLDPAPLNVVRRSLAPKVWRVRSGFRRGTCGNRCNGANGRVARAVLGIIGMAVAAADVVLRVALGGTGVCG